MFKTIREIFGRLFAKDNGLRLDLGDYLYVVRPNRQLRFSGVGPHMRSGYSECTRVKVRGRFLLIPELEPNPHIVICGMSGFGKSTMFGAILRGVAAHGASCMVFDAHNEHSDTVQDLGGTVHENISGSINLLSLDGATVAERISILTGLFKRVYNLGYIQSTKLSDCLWYTYRRFGARSNADRSLYRDPRISDLLYEINVFVRNSRTASERNSLLHLRDRISLLNAPRVGETIDLAKTGAGIHSFSLSGMKGKEERTIYLEELLGRLYGLMKDRAKQEHIRQYIMIDEAQFIINSSDSDMVTRFIEEGRKYGVGVVVATHSSVKLNRQVVANASTFISFYSREPSEAAFVSKVMGHGATEYAVRTMISKLGVHQALVFSARNRAPSVISMARVLPRLRAASGTGSKEHITMVSTRPIRKDVAAARHGCDPKLIDLMVREGGIDSFEADGETWISSRKQNPGLEHEVMVMKMHQTLSDNGIRNYIYDKANGPDVIAFNSGDRIAVEYETGLKNAEESKKMIAARLTDYARVVVVARKPGLYGGMNDRVRVLAASDLSMLPSTVRGQ